VVADLPPLPSPDGTVPNDIVPCPLAAVLEIALVLAGEFAAMGTLEYRVHC